MRKKKHKALEEQYEHYVCERCMEIGAKEVIAEFLEDLKHKDYYWKGYRSSLIEKWEAKKNED